MLGIVIGRGLQVRGREKESINWCYECQAGARRSIPSKHGKKGRLASALWKSSFACLLLDTPSHTLVPISLLAARGQRRVVPGRHV